MADSWTKNPLGVHGGTCKSSRCCCARRSADQRAARLDGGSYAIDLASGIAKGFGLAGMPALTDNLRDLGSQMKCYK